MTVEVAGARLEQFGTGLMMFDLRPTRSNILPPCYVKHHGSDFLRILRGLISGFQNSIFGGSVDTRVSTRDKMEKVKRRCLCKTVKLLSK